MITSPEILPKVTKIRPEKKSVSNKQHVQNTNVHAAVHANAFQRAQGIKPNSYHFYVLSHHFYFAAHNFANVFAQGDLSD